MTLLRLFHALAMVERQSKHFSVKGAMFTKNCIWQGIYRGLPTILAKAMSVKVTLSSMAAITPT